MKQGKRNVGIILLCAMSLLAVATAEGCGGSGQATAQPATATAATVATSPPVTAATTASPPATTAPVATPTADDEAQATPGADGWRPPSGPATPGATPWPLPYCIGITAPGTAHSGDTLMLDIQYKCLLDAQVCAQTKLTFRLDWPRGGSLVDFSPAADFATDGSSPDAGFTVHGVEGQAQMTFKLADQFAGDFGVGIILTGSGLNYRWPDGCPNEEPGTHVTE